MASLKDVAKLSGVSVTTVSRVLNNSSLVNQETRQSVELAMKKLNYRPNLLASGLRSKTSRLIGLIVPDTINFAFASLTQYISNYCQQLSYNLIVGNHHNDPDEEERLIDSFLRRNIDGIIISQVSDDSRASSLLRESSIPLVVIDRLAHGEKMASVLLDNFRAGYLAGEYLIGLGHEHIACIAGPQAVQLFRERLNGFRAALHDHGMEFRSPADIVESGADVDFEAGLAAAKELFSRRSPENYPTAVWAMADLIAIGLLKYTSSIGLRVPRDISIVGMDNVELARMTSPALTTVAQPFQDFAEQAVRLIMRGIEKKNGEPLSGEAAHIVLPPRLVVRESAARQAQPPGRMKSIREKFPDAFVCR